MLQLGTVDIAVSGKNKGSTSSQIIRVHENTASFMPPQRLQHDCRSQPLRVAAPSYCPQTLHPLFLQTPKSPGPLTRYRCHFLMNNTGLYTWNQNTNQMGTQHLLQFTWVPQKSLSRVAIFIFMLEMRTPNPKSLWFQLALPTTSHHIFWWGKHGDALWVLLLLLMFPLSTHSISVLAGIWELNVWTNIIYQ